jgi:hypothetical protein
MLEIILIAVIILQSIIHFFERRDMLNRLMSKSLTEYRQDDKNPPKHIPSAHERVLNKWRNKAGDE